MCLSERSKLRIFYTTNGHQKLSVGINAALGEKMKNENEEDAYARTTIKTQPSITNLELYLAEKRSKNWKHKENKKNQGRLKRS